MSFITNEDQAVSDRIPPEGASGPVIRFHNQRDLPWGCLSNFFPASVVINNDTYPTSEHFFQAMKFFGTSQETVDLIRKTESPGVAAEIGRNRENPLRKDWDLVKEQILFHAILAKFSQHPLLLYSLMQTKFTMLVEWHHTDKYWASGTDFLEGKNRLGVLLMQLRQLFRQYGGAGIPSETEPPAKSCAFLTEKMEQVRSRIADMVSTTKQRPFCPGLHQGKAEIWNNCTLFDDKNYRPSAGAASVPVRISALTDVF